MIVDHEHQFIFIHIEKTGGTSWEHAICEATGMDVALTRQDDAILPGHQCKHINARDLREILGRDVWDSYFKFAVVRNPYDRLLSHWSYHAQMDPRHDWIRKDWRAFPDFRSFLRAIAEGAIRPGRNIQSHMLCDDEGELLVDWVGRFERLADDFDVACEHLGIEAKPLPRLASTKHARWESYYDDATRAAVFDLDQEDFWRFGYPSGLTQSGSPRLGDETIQHVINRSRQEPGDLRRILWLGKRYVMLGAYESAAILFRAAYDLVPREDYLRLAHEALALRPKDPAVVR